MGFHIMLDILSKTGYSSIDSPDDADLVILNTCHIREKAGDKVYSDLGRLRKIKTKKAVKMNSDTDCTIICDDGVNGDPQVKYTTTNDRIQLQSSNVNIELDLVARYLERLLSIDGKTSMNKDFLRANGYA